MAFVDPNIAETVAHMPEVHAAVLAERDRVARIAEALFAPHDDPGRHKITALDEPDDGLVSLEGPAPLAVEFGHWTPDHKSHVEGIHVLTRAIDQAAAG